MTETPEPAEPDYRIDGFEAANERIEENFFSVTASDDAFVPLAVHHGADRRNSYLLFFDSSAIWGVPGAAAYVAVHITRDVEQRTFTFEHAEQPVVPLAQNWLIGRGCPEGALQLSFGPRPADALTSRLEDLLRANPNGRYKVLDHFTNNPSSPDFGVEVHTLVYDSHPDAAHAPYRLFLEETTKDFASYTVREGAFTSQEAAQEWAMNRTTPLPLAPDPASSNSRRADAARARSTTKTTTASTTPSDVLPPRRPTPPSPPRPSRGAR